MCRHLIGRICMLQIARHRTNKGWTGLRSAETLRSAEKGNTHPYNYKGGNYTARPYFPQPKKAI